MMRIWDIPNTNLYSNFQIMWITKVSKYFAQYLEDRILERIFVLLMRGNNLSQLALIVSQPCFPFSVLNRVEVVNRVNAGMFRTKCEG